MTRLKSREMLVFIKLLHSLVWVLLAGCVVCIPLFTLKRRYRAAKIVSIVVWIECLIILVNRGRCPLTDFAARYTTDRAANFDIYLPLWLAKYNKLIFGTAFVLGEAYRLIKSAKDQSLTIPYSRTTPRSSSVIASHSESVPIATRSGPSQ